MKFLGNEQEIWNVLFVCHELHELTRKRKKIVIICVIRGKKPFGFGLSKQRTPATQSPVFCLQQAGFVS
jgi:hypothetical protein